MPSVSDAQRVAVDVDPIVDPHVILLEFRGDGEVVVERAVVGIEDVVFEGNTFVAAGIDVQLPGTGDGEIAAKLTASNVDRIIGRALDGQERRINVRLVLLDLAVPDVAIVDTGNLMVASTSSISGLVVSMQLTARATLQEPVPFQRTTRNLFPGVWV